ncbi:MAG: hypothetical protein ACREX0_11285 [Noviherbaspirillum sp.]
MGVMLILTVITALRLPYVVDRSLSRAHFKNGNSVDGTRLIVSTSGQPGNFKDENEKKAPRKEALCKVRYADGETVK